MESVDTLEATMELVFELLDEPELRDGPSAGIVLQAYLRESPEQLDAGARVGARRRAREPPLVVRLVKGAYWDHEVVEARQHGWTPPVFEEKAESRPQLRGAHAPAARGLAARAAGDRVAQPALGGPRDRRQPRRRPRRPATSSSRCCAASATSWPRRWPTSGMRVRIYCPVGDLVAGMAYLVRRLLENTANESFLGDQQRGVPVDELLAAP